MVGIAIDGNLPVLCADCLQDQRDVRSFFTYQPWVLGQLLYHDVSRRSRQDGNNQGQAIQTREGLGKVKVWRVVGGFRHDRPPYTPPAVAVFFGNWRRDYPYA